MRKEFDRPGSTLVAGIAITRVLALPVLHHATQFHPLAHGARAAAAIGALAVLPFSYTHIRAPEPTKHLVFRPLLVNKKYQ